MFARKKQMSVGKKLNKKDLLGTNLNGLLT
jgi:hypothetical protein